MLVLASLKPCLYSIDNGLEDLHVYLEAYILTPTAPKGRVVDIDRTVAPLFYTPLVIRFMFVFSWSCIYTFMHAMLFYTVRSCFCDT